MKLVVSEQAKSSLLAVRDFYNVESAGLGYEFVNEFVAASERILRYPQAWAVLSKQTRRCLLHRFPYSVIYRLVKGRQEIQIIDLMHQKQKPRY